MSEMNGESEEVGDGFTSANGCRSRICPGARARREAGLQKHKKVIVSWDRIEVEVHNTNSSFEDCRHGSWGEERDCQVSRLSSRVGPPRSSPAVARFLRRTFDREGHVRMGTALHTSYATYVDLYT